MLLRMHIYVATLALLTAACRAGGVRPFFAPLPNALVDTIRTEPDILIRELSHLVEDEGFRIRSSSPEEGYLETDWRDLGAANPAVVQQLSAHRVIRLRFFTDPVGAEGARLAAEAVFRRTLDPSLPAREAEVMVPPGHAGEEILNRIFDAVVERFGHY